MTSGGAVQVGVVSPVLVDRPNLSTSIRTWLVRVPKQAIQDPLLLYTTHNTDGRNYRSDYLSQSIILFLIMKINDNKNSKDREFKTANLALFFVCAAIAFQRSNSKSHFYMQKLQDIKFRLTSST